MTECTRLFDGLRADVLRIRSFLQERMQKEFGVGPVHTCSIKGPPGAKFMVDGYPEEAGYSGEYFEGQSLRIKAAGEEAGGFSHWLVNGEQKDGKDGCELDLPVTAPLTIEAVYSVLAL